jgi:uncharacterized membrane protein YqjE
VIREPSGIVADIRGIGATGVRAVRTRLELAVVELQEEKVRLTRSLLVASAALYLAIFGLALAIAAFAFAASEAARPVILAVCAFVFLAAAVAGGAWLRSQSARHESLLSSTLDVLKGDEAALRSAAQASGD